MTPMVDIEVGGTRREAAVEAILDTGFEGEICAPVELAVSLGLELVGTDVVELADGSQKQEFLFAGEVNFLGKKQEVVISLTDGEDTLIGTELLADCTLSVDFQTGKVLLSRKKRGRGRG